MKTIDEETLVNQSNNNNNEDTMVANEETVANNENDYIEETTNNNEDTIGYQNDTMQYEEPQKKGSWKKVMIGGVTGILIGAGGAMLTGAATALNDPDAPHAGENDDNHNVTTLHDNPGITVDGLPVATTVNDDMTFGEAFAAAREEVGPGGVFEWHGGVYGTYYADEWSNMTSEEQADFGSHISYGGAGQQQEEPTTNTNEPYAEEIEVKPEQEAEVQILGVSQDTLDDGTPVTVGHLSANGEDVYVVDVDQNGQFDVIMQDLNGDGQITRDEIFDISDQGMTVESLQQQSAMQDPNYLAQNNQPDYINDADPAGFNA